MKSRATIAIGLVALVAAGCGGGSSGGPQGVKSTFDTITRDIASRNPAACNYFTKRYALVDTGQSSYSAALASCRRRIQSGGVTVPKKLKLGKVKVKGKSASIKVTSPTQGSSVFRFVNQSGHWKVDAVTAR